MIQVAQIFRFPVKGLGDEALQSTEVVPGLGIPGDRKWALAHNQSTYDPQTPAHQARRNFVQTAHCAALAQTSTSLTGDALISASHPLHGPVTADLSTEEGAQALCEWSKKVAGSDQAGPYRLAHVADQPMWDVAQAQVSLASTSVLEDLSLKTNASMQMRRFRNNIWLDGLAPGEEFELVGKEVTLGTVRLKILEPNTRCAAPGANPETGIRDIEVTERLHEFYGHMDFGLYTSVISGGQVSIGDTLNT